MFPEMEGELDRGKRVLGVVMIFVCIGALVTWERWGKERLLYEEVVVLNKNVERGVVISKDMLEVKKIDRAIDGSISVSRAYEIIGKETTGFIHKEVPIFKENFKDTRLILSKKRDQYQLTVPLKWLEAWPEGISKGCQVFFYSEGKVIFSSLVESVGDENESFNLILSARQVSMISSNLEGGKKYIVSYVN